MLEAQLPWIASLQTVAQFTPIYFLLKLAIFMSEENVIILTTCTLFWLVDRRIAVTALLLVLGSEYINFILKWTVHEPRPYWMTETILPLSRQPDFGFPTAYAQDALVYWVYLASALGTKFNSRRFWIFPATIVPLVSFATIAFGANFFHDTIAGLAIGAVTLAGARYATSKTAGFFAVSWRQSVSLVVCVALMIGVVIIRGMTIGDVKLEGTWKQLALSGSSLPPYLVFSPWNSNAIFTICAAIVAVAFYLELSRRGIISAFIPAEGRRIVLARLLVGLMGLVLIKFVLVMALEGSKSVSIAALFSVGYFSIATWALVIAPIITNRVEQSNWFTVIFRQTAESA